MFELVKSGGWLMVPLIAASVVALAIIGERLWTLRKSKVVPRHLVAQVWHWSKNKQLDNAHINLLRTSSPLGRVLAAGLVNRHHSREVIRETIEDTGRHVIHELERYLNSLGTISVISPLLGLLGTVVGIMKVFDTIRVTGVGNPNVLSGGIAEALITTVAGLSVAIPSLMFYRYLRGRVDELVIEMEQEAIKLVEVLQGMRERDGTEGDER
ncbi:MAG: MotA/TolQ/ExbB proton channel family protein [Gammaproteobacteria bacterium]|nr:MotA/TolQ/ExbB proton channel family protein [Gammaproteobacteria bacterium]